MGGSGSSVVNGTTVFTGVYGQSATEAPVEQLFPVTQSFTKMWCFGPKPTSNTSNVFTLRVAGSNTTATCSMPSGTTTAVTNTFTAVSIPAGSLIDVQIAQGNAAGQDYWGLAP